MGVKLRLEGTAVPRRDHTFWEIPVDPEVLTRFRAPEPEHPGDPQKQQIRAAAVAQLRTVIETKLTPRQRQIVQAYFFDGRTEAEIARELGIAQQVVSRHLFGALRAGHRVGGALTRLRRLAEELDIDPAQWV
jgi:RNA polymerase sigma factor (sigma-70 family)